MARLAIGENDDTDALDANAQTLGPTDTTNLRSRDFVDYGNGVIGKNLGNGRWQYDALGRSFDDLLGDNEVSGQLELKKIRDKAAQMGLKVDAGDANLSNLYTSSGSSVDGTIAALQQQQGSSRDAALQQVSSTYTSAGAPAAASAYTSGLRDILAQQLGQASQPVSANDPGVRDILAGERLASQRSAERQQGANAERLAGMGLADSGAAETGRQGIEQNRGERDVMATGQVLSQELGQRRQQLQNLLQLALMSGDTESARQVQMELAKLQQSQHDDQLAFGYAGLDQQSNLAALNAILGLGA